jgi:tetratricopeptide (TPR) repeat protein
MLQFNKLLFNIIIFSPLSSKDRAGCAFFLKTVMEGTVMKIFFLPLMFLLAHVFFPAPSASFANQENAGIFSEANLFFQQANAATTPEEARKLYEKALLRYEKLSRDVKNGKLYYNIGNTYYVLDDIGRAIVNFRRAEKFIPDDDNLRQNLTYVLSKLQDSIPEKQEEKLLRTLFFWHFDLAHDTRMRLFAVCYIGFWLAAGFMFFSPRPTSRWLAGSLLATTLLFSASLAIEHFTKSPATGVIVAPEIVARQGDGHNYQPSFTAPLHAGTEFRLLEDRKNWLRVELHDGRQCWLPAQSTELI